MKKIIDANFYPVLSWHPSWPRKEGEKLEADLWEETNKWDGGIILWLVSPDKKVHEPIDYHEKKTGKVTSAKQLEEKIREILKKNDVVFVEPKEEKK